MARTSKPLPEFPCNGWTVRKRPNSFAEQYVWEATAVDADGYLTARRGFQRQGDAVVFARNNEAPKVRGAGRIDP